MAGFHGVVRNSERDLLRLSAERFLEHYPTLLSLASSLEVNQANLDTATYLEGDVDDAMTGLLGCRIVAQGPQGHHFCIFSIVGTRNVRVDCFDVSSRSNSGGGCFDMSVGAVELSFR